MGAIGNGAMLDASGNDGAIRFADAEHGDPLALSQALRDQTGRVDGLRQDGHPGLTHLVDAALDLADDRDAGSTLSCHQHPDDMTDLHRACRRASSIDVDRRRRTERYVDVVDDDAAKTLDGPDDAGSTDTVVFVLSTSNGKTGASDAMIAGARRLRGCHRWHQNLERYSAQEKLSSRDR
ncbi:hypothetical protein FHT80_005425 [Rhizobium sp. BK226]|nr:hypothetical protein [Rhizobium sp. BK112]MBB3371093.1 hypothetical protein [Rhizobium sp. BK077]MBB3746405.1 hypothetical protein [Rhizobium sp. BK591]MBB4116053.1 hypothetical protein [Rhizobium sp. BK226]MBB4181861.1 hypothetical protein [Rhizobium sp. BK109]